MAESEERKRTIAFTASFSETDMHIYKALEDYTKKTGKSINAYIKELIKKDLDKWETRKQ